MIDGLGTPMVAVVAVFNMVNAGRNEAATRLDHYGLQKNRNRRLIRKTNIGIWVALP